MVSGTASTRPAQHRILQIAYYDSLLRTRATMLQRAGYAVVSVLGNDQAKAGVDQLLPAVDLVMVGFSATYAERIAIVRWLKEQYPQVPVVVLQANSSERFPDANYVTLSEDPEVWLGAIAACLEHNPGGSS